MKPEEKFDRSIQNIVKKELLENPSPGFTDAVLEKLGVRRLPSKEISKPILSNWAKIGIAASYLILFVLIIFLTKGEPASSSSYLNLLKKVNLSSFTSLLNFSGPMYSILVILIIAGWLLIVADRFLKKVLAR